ncbi:MAG TPA: hypothetical protein VGF38_22970 [Ktedonobacterales bacterium]
MTDFAYPLIVALIGLRFWQSLALLLVALNQHFQDFLAMLCGFCIGRAISEGLAYQPFPLWENTT